MMLILDLFYVIIISILLVFFIFRQRSLNLLIPSIECSSKIEALTKSENLVKFFANCFIVEVKSNTNNFFKYEKGFVVVESVKKYRIFDCVLVKDTFTVLQSQTPEGFYDINGNFINNSDIKGKVIYFLSWEK